MKQNTKQILELLPVIGLMLALAIIIELANSTTF
jgi:hypothetical protein